jgi:hypothetical protein
MAIGDVETYHAGGLWHNHRCGYPQVVSSHLVKDDAIAAGRALALESRVDHIVRKITGGTAAQVSYRESVAG